MILGLDAQKWLFMALGAVLVVVLVRALVHRDRDRHSRFSFEELLIDPATKQTSIVRALASGAFLTTSFIVAFQAFAHTLTDATFGAYMLGWVAPLVAKINSDGGVAKAAATPASGPTIVDRQVNIPGGDGKSGGSS